MKLEKIALIISLIGILTLTLLSQIQNQKIQGEIESIEKYNGATKITLKNNLTSIIFSKNFIDIKIGDEILIEGKNKTYQNENQFVANKIIIKNK